MRKVKEPYFDGEQLYRKYFSMGQVASVTTLARYAVSTGMTHSERYKNKAKLPRMGVWKAMWRWASLKENREEAYKIFQSYVKDYGWKWDSEYTWKSGEIVSWSQWSKYMLKTIKSAWQYAPARHRRFLEENGWL